MYLKSSCRTISTYCQHNCESDYVLLLLIRVMTGKTTRHSYSPHLLVSIPILTSDLLLPAAYPLSFATPYSLLILFPPPSSDRLPATSICSQVLLAQGTTTTVAAAPYCQALPFPCCLCCHRNLQYDRATVGLRAARGAERAAPPPVCLAPSLALSRDPPRTLTLAPRGVAGERRRTSWACCRMGVLYQVSNGDGC